MNYWLALSKNSSIAVKLVSFVNQLKLFYFSFIMALKLVEFGEVFGISAIPLPKSFTKCALLLWFLDEEVPGSETRVL